MWYVYTITTDTVSYAGMTSDPHRRWAEHIKCASGGYHHNKAIAQGILDTTTLTFTIVFTHAWRETALAFEASLHAAGYLGLSHPKRTPAIDPVVVPVGVPRCNCLPVVRGDGTVFPSIVAAALSIDGDPDKIRLCCNNPKRSHKGYRWAFV